MVGIGRCRLQHLTDAALAAAEVGDFNTAAAQFGQALQLGAKDAALHEQRAQCLMELEQYDDALLAAETATTLQPEVCTDSVLKSTAASFSSKHANRGAVI